MDYQYAKDAFDELKNFEGKADFKGTDTVIDYFVLLPKSALDGFDIRDFLATHQSTGSFEIEGGHEDEKYTLIGISTARKEYSNDVDYFLKLLVW
ncbi:hypothetical protein OGH69_00435 [Flavobacterium sp. MFBS3-15]|uniref:hypothetical protein n=1 Tax=Flavobacterium sp. MFBS3-15 TaxID=2989816 RepID=UPI002235ED47|nr:hypothetical protein [Flavobacterium sp. MFBS3-15]MCW4467420.1 hypothetical protein [Flavobacterium sp. MFBS3-15]